ncbi:MAG: S-ribosylhomocysteinase [Firmicutes bacterium ADurb.Bin467]|nr:MAG: S-ribosylhomocysteinase [Firmicutes bacterium ADurb.Bin467]
MLELVRGMLEFIGEFEGDIPGASASDCGNHLDMDLAAAREIAKRYRAELLPGRTAYPL